MKALWTSLLATLILFCNIGFACTDFRLTAKDGSVLITRSLEFALDLKSNLRTSNRNRTFTTTLPDGTPGMTWKAKNGYLFLDGLNIDAVVDGLNEKGLAFEALYLPGLAEYQTVPPDHKNQGLFYLNLGDWILGSFDSVDQVRDALKNVYVYSAILPAAGNMVYPLHFAIHDATGKSIVVEYIGGKLNIHDNKIGVMTNSPSYDWHMTNLTNYVHLLPKNPNPVVINGVTFAATGEGFGMIGVPGDITPASRFVKVATMLGVVMPAQDSTGLLNLAEHIINNVDIPLGLAREKEKDNFTNELTQWVVFKDLTHKVLYYRTYNNLTLRGIDLTKLNFAENAPRLLMSIGGGPYIQDMSSQFLKSTQAS